MVYFERNKVQDIADRNHDNEILLGHLLQACCMSLSNHLPSLCCHVLIYKLKNTNSRVLFLNSLKLEAIIVFILPNFLHKETIEFRLQIITLTKYYAIPGQLQLYSWWSERAAHWYSFFSFAGQGATHHVCLDRKGWEVSFRFPDISLPQSMIH